MSLLDFNKITGSAQKSEVKYTKLAEGDNTFRILPRSILPGYMYWVKGANGKDLPFECLQYDRENEKFNNFIADPVKDANLKDKEGKDLRCQWSYRCQVINKSTGGVEVLQLKKGILNGIIDVAGQMGIDPTDVETGTWFTVKKAKTGPLAYNVEYTVKQLMCKSEPLGEEDLAMLVDLKKMDELFKLETYAEQAARLAKHLSGAKEVEEATKDNVDSEAVDDLTD